MLNETIILDKMKKVFPKWMDIRKRIGKSKGGAILTSVANETFKIQDAIDEFKKTFFIDNYFGSENKIITFLYKAQIGRVDIKKIQVISPDLTLTTNIDYFYNVDNACYYDNDYLYFKQEHIENNSNINKNHKKIEYAINSYSIYAEIEKFHVWNVFDEFASFVGIRRHLWEDNESLEKRILRVNEHIVNSTKEGLKNAIMNELFVLEPDLKLEEIKIESPCPDNLLKYYDEFETVLDKMSRINKDIYKTKQWDIDSWNHDLNSIDYIPHAWDAYIKNYKNGVGFEDDLKVLASNKGKGTSLKISFYKERLKNIKQYIKDKNPKIDVSLKLKKYNNKLKSNKVTYKITAGTAKEISSYPISIKGSIEVTKNNNLLLEDIITDTENNTKDITILDNTLLPDNDNYRIEITPKEDYDYFTLKKCGIEYIDDLNKQTVSLLKESDNFKFNSAKELINMNTKMCVKNINDLMEHDNLINSTDGIQIENLANEAVGKINIKTFKKENIYIKHDCLLSDFLEDDLIINNFKKENDKYIAQKTSNQKIIEISGKYNDVSIKLNGSYNISYTIDGVSGGEFNNGNFVFNTNKKFTEPKQMNIKITCTGNSLEVSEIKYSKYSIKFYLGSKEFNDAVIPDTKENILTFKINTEHGFSPSIEKIYIGNSVKNEKYTTDIIKNIKNKKRKIIIRGNVKIKLIKNDKVFIDNYQPYLTYKSTSDKSYIKLDLNKFNNIQKINSTKGTIQKINSEYFLFLKKNEEIKEINIYGSLKEIISNKTLNSILNINTAKGDKLYISSLLQGFVVEKNNDQNLTVINKNILGLTNNSKVDIENLPQEFITKFIINKDDNKTILSNNYIGNFEEMLIVPKDSQEYIAYNEENIYQKFSNNIEIVNNFSPLLPKENTLLAYRLERINDDIDVRFDDKKSFDSLKKWTIGKKKIAIKSLKDLKNINEYSTELLELKEKVKLNDVIKLSPKYEINGKLVNLTEYILDTDKENEIVFKYRTKTISISESLIKEPEYYYVEKITCEKDMFNKLKHSNIDDIIYIGDKEWKDDKTISNIKNDKYNLLKEQGIITWKDENLIGNIVYVLYSIKIPDYIKMNINKLYKSIDYSINAYELLGEKEYLNLNHNDIVDISKDYLFKNSTKIILECSNPGFTASIDKGIIRISFIAKEKELIVKTGYYYDNGDEFYFFNNQDKFLNKIDNNEYIDYYNVRKEDGSIVFTKGSKNYITNSIMKKDYSAETYYNNFKRLKSIKGISNLNTMTACDNFNNWNTIGTSLKLTKGINDVGILFEQQLENGYGFIDITDYLSKQNFMSLYCNGPEVFIGKELKFNNLSFSKSTSIQVLKKLTNPYNDNFKETTFTKEDNYKYYLIVTGTGVIDDIVLSDTSIDRTTIHTKNIDKLGLKINEKDSGNYIRKIIFDTNRGSKCSGAELDKNNIIVNSSHLDWNLTNIKNINSKEDFQRCEMERLDITNNIVTSREKGKIITDPISLNNIESINNLVVKINKLYFKNMINFNITVLGSDKMYGLYNVIMKSSSNIFEISHNKIMPYMKISIEMQKNKIIESIDIFANYKTTNNVNLKTYYYSNGEFTTKITDTQSSLNYKVSNINIDSISNINEVDIFIRAAREGNNNQWMPWKKININQELKINNEIRFNNCRFFQAKVKLKSRMAYVKLTNIDLEVI